MLSKEEELKLQYVIEEIGTECLPSIDEIKWLVEKLKETHAELKLVTEERDRLQKPWYGV